MSFDPHTLPDSLLRKMSPEDRAALGRAGRTQAECAEVADQRSEKELQNDMVKLLDQRNLFFSRSRMDKQTSVRVGLFDFTIYLPGGKFLAVEAKVAGGRLSPAQEKLFAEFTAKTGQPVYVLNNLSLLQALLNVHAPLFPAL